MKNLKSLKTIIEIADSTEIPSPKILSWELSQTIKSIKTTPEYLRPKDQNNYPGGLLNLPTENKVVLIPDLHGRYDFLIKTLQFKENVESIYQQLENKQVTVLCVGDAMHTETNTEQRWRKAYNEYLNKFETDDEMRLEMIQNLKTIRIILKLIQYFPKNFFFLKGNHENILNNNKNGNHEFGKFVFEGEMVNSWIKKNYGDDIIHLFFLLEESFPILAISKNFMVSHSEPADFYEKEDVINYKVNPNVVEGLTWTQKGDLMNDAVANMKREFIPNTKYSTFYFAGHRAIKGKIHLRKKDNFVQIHNPDKQNIGVINSDREIDIKTLIYTLD